MIEVGMEWQVIDTPIQLKEVSSIATPYANKLKLYAKDNGSGVSALYYKNDAGSEIGPLAAAVTTLDHGVLTGLTDDDHTIYALLAGRSGGQTLKGGTASGDDLTLMSTNHATKGHILFGTSGYDEVNNKLGIGTTSPFGGIEVSGAGVLGQVYATRIDSVAAGPGFIGRKARAGTTAVTADDVLVQLVGQGRDSAGAYATGANVKEFAAEAWTGSAHGTYLTFETTPTGSTTVAERLRVEASGDISHASGVRFRMLSQNRTRFLNSMASVKMAGDQTLTHNTVTTVNFGAEDIDTDALHDNSSNNSRITIALTGKYLIGGVLNYAANGTGVRQIRLHQDGSATPIRISAVPGMAGDNARPAAVWLVSATAGAYFELKAFQDSGGDLTLSSSAPNSHFFAVYMGE